MIQKLQLEIPLLLPDIPNEQDGCVARLQEDLLARRGVNRAHVIRENGEVFVVRRSLHGDSAFEIDGR